MMQRVESALVSFKFGGALTALAAGVVWGMVCGLFRAPYAAVVIGGLAAAALGFWLERAVLITPETSRRKDFYVILVAGYGFFAIVGVGLVALSDLLATWWLPRL